MFVEELRSANVYAHITAHDAAWIRSAWAKAAPFCIIALSTTEAGISSFGDEDNPS